MKAKVIKGSKIASNIERKIKTKVGNLKKQNIHPKLGVIFIGNNKPSQNYITKKKEKAKELGINFELYSYSKDVSKKKIKQELKEIQQQNNLSGLIIQLPIPDKLDPQLLDQVKPNLDVDCLTSQNIGKLVKDVSIFTPPTVGAILEILSKTTDTLKGKNITIVGTGILVGKPTAIMLINKEATVTTCNEFTSNLKQKCLQADILISGVGKKHLIKKEMVPQNGIIIDAGLSYQKGKIYGDVQKDGIEEKVTSFTPTPGGVGPITVAKLFENVAKASETITADN